MKKILFVCTGNTCRSPMAEGFLKYEIAKDDKLAGKYSVSSAGISVNEGDRASQNSIKVMKEEWEIDISGHISKLIKEGDIASVFLVLTMTRQQKSVILTQYPSASKRVYTLKEFTRGVHTSQGFEQYDYTLDITDPYGMPPQIYSICAREIKESVSKLAVMLKET